MKTMNPKDYYKKWSGTKGDIPKSTIHFHQELLEFAEAYHQEQIRTKSFIIALIDKAYDKGFRTGIAKSYLDEDRNVTDITK
jgi:hypothetical protein